MPPINPKEAKNAFDYLSFGVDRLGFKIIGALGRIFGSLAGKDEETYWYGINSEDGQGFVDLTAVIGNLATADIVITQESDFVATRILAITLNPATGVPIVGSWTANIRDGSTDRNLMNFQTHESNLVGTAQRSVPFTKNRLFRRNSNISFEFTQRQAVASRIFLTIQGYKIFDEAALDLIRRR